MQLSEILAVITAVVKKNLPVNTPYGIDSNVNFRLLSKRQQRNCHFSSVGRAHHS